MCKGGYTLCSAMITTLMPHLSIGPYKEGVLIVQIQMQFYIPNSAELDAPSLMSSWLYKLAGDLWCNF